MRKYHVEEHLVYDFILHTAYFILYLYTVCLIYVEADMK